MTQKYLKTRSSSATFHIAIFESAFISLIVMANLSEVIYRSAAMLKCGHNLIMLLIMGLKYFLITSVSKSPNFS